MKIREMLLSGLFTALVIISSYIVIPIGPVPHTLQPLVVILSGFLLGPKWGPISIITWIVLGCLGLPVFNQGQAGAVMLVGPTGGFIIGFIILSWLVGKFTSNDPRASFYKNFAYLTFAMLICYVFGLVGFKLSFTYFLQKPMSWEKSMLLAIAPFLPFDIIKAAIAAYVGAKVRGALKAAGLW